MQLWFNDMHVAQKVSEYERASSNIYLTTWRSLWDRDGTGDLY